MKKLLSFILAVGITSNLCVFAQNSGENEIGQDLLEHEKFMQIEQERVESENPIFEESLLNENQVLSKAEGEWYGDLLFDKITGTITDANTGISGDLVIPSEIDGVSVTTIGHKAFYFCRDLTSVEMPNSVTTIDDYAFSSCVNLISIEIPNSVATIGTYAFEHCRSLTSIQIPDSITSIGNYVFYNCGSLISINVDEKNEYYIADEHGVLFNIDKTELLQYPIGNERTSYIIPNTVTSIVDGAFSDCLSLTSIEIPNSVTTIGNDAFENCYNLTNIQIPNSVTAIGDNAFYYCEGLTNIEIPNSVTTIGDSAFSYCNGLTSINVDEGNEYYIADEYGVLFNIDKTELLQYPIGNERTSYIIPNTVTSIGDRAFGSCKKLISIELPNSVTTIGDGVFSNCRSLTSIELPNNITSIRNYAFRNCYNLTSIKLPNSLTSIGEEAFKHCRSLTNIEIPNTVTSIGEYAFRDCYSLTSINIDEGNEYYITDEYGVLFNIDKTELLQYPVGNERTSYIIPNTVTTIKDFAFYSCQGLTSIVIPNSVTTIDHRAFSHCRGLTSIELSNSLTTIENSVFWNCDSLINVVIPNSVTTIGNSAFRNCDSLINVVIPNSVTTIGNSAFWNCSSLTNVEIPSSVTSIANSAFTLCSSLTSINVDEKNEYYTTDEYGVLYNIDKTELLQYPAGNENISYTIPNGVTSINYYTFYSCKNLASIEIPDSVTTIGGYAFEYCTSLRSIQIPDSITSIGEYAFKGCIFLTDVYYSGNKSQWDAITIESDNENLTNATIHYDVGSITLESNVVESKVIIDIDSKSNENAELIIAFYNDGKLVGIEQREILKGSKTETVDIPQIEIDSYEVFAWDSIQSMKPLSYISSGAI